MKNALWLVGLFLALNLPPLEAQSRLKESDFTPAAKCGECHEEIYNQWQQSMHSRSLSDPIYRAVLQKVLEQQGESRKIFCLSCHAPVASVTGGTLDLPVPIAWDSWKGVSAEGVTCDFCHTLPHASELATGILETAYVFPRSGMTRVKYGRHADAQTEAHATQVGELLTSSEFCATCHRFKHPVSGLELQNTYDEWLAGPYPARGIRCQDCHMPAYSGASAKQGPRREKLHAHFFLGGHTSMVARAATVTVWGKTNGSQLEITTNVTNSGAGHSIPTGVPGMREIRLEVRVLDGRGAEQGKRTFRYGLRLLNSLGDESLPWEAFKSIQDKRVLPEKSRQERFQLQLQPDAQGPFKVEAHLYLHLLKEELSQRLELQAPEPVLMTSGNAMVN